MRAGGTVALAAIVLVALGYVLAVGTDFGLRGDGAGVPSDENTGVFRRSLSVATHALNPASAVLAAAVIFVLAGRRGRDAVIAAGVILIGSGVSAFVLEGILPAADPLQGEKQRALGEGFFPSGHAAGAMALLLALIVVMPGVQRVRAAALGSVAVSLLGIGNLVTESHHPSDILAGYLLAAAWAAAVVVCLPRQGDQPTPEPMRTVWTVLAASLAVPALIVAGFVLERPRNEVGEGFLGASVAVALLAVALTGVVMAIATAPGRAPRPERCIDEGRT